MMEKNSYISQIEINGSSYPLRVSWENIENKPAVIENYVINKVDPDVLKDSVIYLAKGLININLTTATEEEKTNSAIENTEILEKILNGETVQENENIKGKSIVFIPEGTYLFNQIIFNQISNKIILAESNDTVIKYLDSNKDSLFSFNNCKDIKIINGTFEGNSLQFENSSHIDLENIQVQNILNSNSVGLKIFGDSCKDININNINISNISGNGIFINHIDENSSVFIKNTTISSCGKYGIVASGSQINIIDTEINAQTDSCLNISDCINATIKNCDFIGNSTHDGIVFSGSNKNEGALIEEDILIKDCSFDGMRYSVSIQKNNETEKASKLKSFIFKDCSIKTLFGDAVVYLDSNRFSSINKIVLKDLKFLHDTLREVFSNLDSNVDPYLLKINRNNKDFVAKTLILDCDNLLDEYFNVYENEPFNIKNQKYINHTEEQEKFSFIQEYISPITYDPDVNSKISSSKRPTCDRILVNEIPAKIDKKVIILQPSTVNENLVINSTNGYFSRIHLREKIKIKKGFKYLLTIENDHPNCFVNDNSSKWVLDFISNTKSSDDNKNISLSKIVKQSEEDEDFKYFSDKSINNYIIELQDGATEDKYEIEWIDIFPNLNEGEEEEDNYLISDSINIKISVKRLLPSILKKQISFITPEMFGAKCDGVFDDSVAIQEAIDYAIYNDVPFRGTSGATYYIENPIEIEFDTKLYKYGDFDFQGAEIKVNLNKLKGSFQKYAIRFCSDSFGGSHDDAHSKIGISNVILTNATKEINHTGIYQELVHTGLYIQKSQGAIFEKSNFYNFRRGIFMENSGESIIKDCTSRRNRNLDLFEQIYVALSNNNDSSFAVSIEDPFGGDSPHVEELRNKDNDLLAKIIDENTIQIKDSNENIVNISGFTEEDILNDFTINLGKSGCIGFEINCDDAFIENCVTVDHLIGIKIAGGDNKIHGCHPWNMGLKQLASSCCFMTNGNNYFTNNTCDRFHIGFYCRYNIPNFFTNTLFTNQSLNKNDNIAKENYCWYLDPSYAGKTSGHVVKAINTHVTGNRKSEKRSLRWCNSQALLINDTNTTGYVLDGYIPKKISDGKLSKIQSVNHIALNYKEISEDLIHTQYLNLSYNNETKIFSTSFKTDNDLKTRFISINRNSTTLQSYFDPGKKYLISFKYILNVDKSNSSPEKVETLPAVRVLFKPANGSDRSLGMGSFLRYYTKDTSSFKLSPSEQNNFKTWYNIIDLPKEQGQYIFQIMREYNSNEYDISFSIKDIQIYELPSELPQYLFENGWSYANRLYNFCYPKEEDNNELTLQNEAYNNIQKNIEFYDNDNSNTYDILDNNNTLSDTSGKEKYIIKFDYKITIKNDGNFPRNSFIQIFTDNNVAVENKITSKSGTFYGVFSKSNTSNIQVKKTEENNGTEIRKIEIKNLYIQKIQFDLNTTINTDIIDKILEYQSEINNNTKKIKLIKDEDINNYSFTSLKYPLNFNLLSINDTQNDSLDHDYYHVGYDAMGRTQVKSLCDAENKENGVVVSQKKIYAKVNFQNKKSGLINFLVANGGQQFTPILNEQNKYIIENGENSQDYVLISTNKDGEEEVQRGSSFCLFETRYQGNNNLTRYFNSSNTFKMTDGIANQYTFSNGSTGQKIESESKDTSSVQHTLAVAYEGNRDVIINILPNTKGSVRHTEADGKTLKNYEDDERDIVQINSFNLLDEEDSFNSHVINSGDFIPVYNNGQIYAIKRGVEPPEENEYLPTIAYSLNNDIYFKDENNYITSLELSDFSQNLETSIINNLGLKENLSNKVQEINENSTDIEYPSAAAVYQLFESNQESPSGSGEDSSINIVQDIDENSSIDTVPSAKAVWDLSIAPLSTRENLSNKVDEININDIHNDEYYPTVDAIINYINPSIIQDIITDYLDTHLLNYINNDICEDSTFRQNIQNIINSNSSGGGSNNSGE